MLWSNIKTFGLKHYIVFVKKRPPSGQISFWPTPLKCKISKLFYDRLVGCLSRGIERTCSKITFFPILFWLFWRKVWKTIKNHDFEMWNGGVIGQQPISFFRPLLWPSEIWWFADVFFAGMLFSNLNLSEPMKICNSQKPLSVSFPIFLALHLTIQKIAANIRDADSTKRQKRHSLSLKLTKKLPLFKSCSLSLPVST